MNNAQDLKNTVKKQYAQVAQRDKTQNASTCCGGTSPSNETCHIMADDYTHMEGYVEDADLALGCGLPTQFAKIKPGDTVVDLGSGAGNDCFIARHKIGSEGKVIGIDFTPEMLEKARVNATKKGFLNVEFLEGDIDDIPLDDNVADVIVSNCVLNLVPKKEKVINEIFRVLKPSGHFSISDIVLLGNLPDALCREAEMYVGCIAGAIQKDDYLRFIQEAGFQNIILQKEKRIVIPNDILRKYLSQEELEYFRKKETGIFSITVYAEKYSK